MDAEPHTTTSSDLRTKAKILSGIAFTDYDSTSLPSDLLGTWTLSTKRSAVLPTTTAAYLALEAAAAKYAPKAASNAIEAAQKEWWDNIGKHWLNFFGKTIGYVQQSDPLTHIVFTSAM